MKSMAWIIVGFAAAIIGVLFLTRDANEGSPDTTSEVAPQRPPAERIDKSKYPSYDGANIAGLADYMARDSPGNCTASYIQRVRKLASDKWTYQPVVFPEYTEEFIDYLRSACSAAGHPIH